MKRALSFFCLVFLARTLVAAEDRNTGFRVIEEKSGNGVTLIMKSDYCTEFTVTLEATLKNMTSSRPLPLTVDGAGRTSFVLARFKTTDKARAWSYEYRY